MSLVSNLFFIVCSGRSYCILSCACKVAMAGAVGFQLYLLHSGRHQICWLSAVFHVCNLLTALAIEKMETAGKHKTARKFVILGLVLNFGMLGLVKYTNFAIENLNACFIMNLRGMQILLPLGISFYTFQSSGYILDVYWKRCKAEHHPLKYALFVSFFPQILQGPIGRYSRLAHQLYEPHKFESANITRGLERILWGFFKKMILADWSAVFVDAILIIRISMAAWQSLESCFIRYSCMRIFLVEWML